MRASGRAGPGRAVSQSVRSRDTRARSATAAVPARAAASEPHRGRVAERSGLRSRGWRRAHAMQLRPPVLRWGMRACPAARVVGGSRSMTWKITTSYLPEDTAALSAATASTRSIPVEAIRSTCRQLPTESQCTAVTAARTRLSPHCACAHQWAHAHGRRPPHAIRWIGAPPHRPAKPRGPNRDGL